MIHYICSHSWNDPKPTDAQELDHVGYDDETDEICFLYSKNTHARPCRMPLKASLTINHACLASIARDTILSHLAKGDLPLLYMQLIPATRTL